MCQGSFLGSLYQVASDLHANKLVLSSLLDKGERILVNSGFGELTHLSNRVVQSQHSDWGNVVIKLAASTKHKACLYQEAIFLNEFHSPYWPSYCDYFSSNGIDILVTKHLNGTPLSKLLSQGVFKSSWIKEIEKSVSMLHSKAMIHGDLKPSNILITHDGGAKLIDFGSVQLIGCERADSRFASYTPTYAHPNVINSKGVVSIQDDWYSLGRMFLNATEQASSDADVNVNVNVPSYYRIMVKQAQKSG